MRVPAVVGERDRLALDGVRPVNAVRTRRASSLVSASSAVLSWGTGWVVSWYVVSRRLAASAERTRSTALRCVIVISQEIALPLAWSYLLAVRHTSRYASCVTSWAWAGSRTTRRAKPVGPR